MPCLESVSPGILAYMGLGTGAELLPYFVALLSFVGAALVAVVQRPVILFIRWLKRSPKQSDDAPAPVVEPAQQGASGNNE